MLDIFQQAEDILHMDRTPALEVQVEEDTSDWIQNPVPADHLPGRWQYAFHPPAGPKEFIVCKCGCLSIRLLKTYHDKYPYWCFHCGPQETVHIRD
jgi:hypothetical protein